jgi:hypothetical protein
MSIRSLLLSKALTPFVSRLSRIPLPMEILSQTLHSAAGIAKKLDGLHLKLRAHPVCQRRPLMQPGSRN